MWACEASNLLFTTSKYRQQKSHSTVVEMFQPRSSTIALTKALLLLISYIPALHSRPTNDFLSLKSTDGFPEEDPSSPVFWSKLGISVILVLVGGVFSGRTLFHKCAYLGLTLALLSQDEITVGYCCGHWLTSSYKSSALVVSQMSNFMR